jgi:hypothetical protein
MATARWAMWHASKGLERERMSQLIESGAFVTGTAESDLKRAGQRTIGKLPSYRDRSGERGTLSH